MLQVLKGSKTSAIPVLYESMDDSGGLQSVDDRSLRPGCNKETWNATCHPHLGQCTWSCDS